MLITVWERYSVAKAHRMPSNSISFYNYMLFFAKSPIMCGSLSERDLKFKESYASTPHCTEWLMLVGSIKLQVSFAKEPYKRDAILPKRPIILSILYKRDL